MFCSILDGRGSERTKTLKQKRFNKIRFARFEGSVQTRKIIGSANKGVEQLLYKNRVILMRYEGSKKKMFDQASQFLQRWETWDEWRLLVSKIFARIIEMLQVY